MFEGYFNVKNESAQRMLLNNTILRRIYALVRAPYYLLE